MYSIEDLELIKSGLDYKIQSISDEIEKLRDEKLEPLLKKRNGIILNIENHEYNLEIESLNKKIEKVKNNTKFSEEEKEKKINNYNDKIIVLSDKIKDNNFFNEILENKEEK